MIIGRLTQRALIAQYYLFSAVKKAPTFNKYSNAYVINKNLRLWD